MRVPKAKSNVLMHKRLQHIDGVKDIKIGPASVEAREKGNAHVTGQGADVDESGFADAEERRTRYGFLY